MSQLVLNEREAAKESENTALGWDEAAPSHHGDEGKGPAIDRPPPCARHLEGRAGFIPVPLTLAISLIRTFFSSLTECSSWRLPLLMRL